MRARFDATFKECPVTLCEIETIAEATEGAGGKFAVDVIICEETEEQTFY